MADMQDLINEEEFIAKKNDYNPWRRFGVFYAVVLFHIILFNILSEVIKGQYVTIYFSIFNLLFPIGLANVMVLTKKKMVNVSLKVIVAGVLGFTATYFLGLILIEMFFYGVSEWGLTDNIYNYLIASVIYLTISLIIIIPAIKYKKRMLKQRL